MKRSNTVHGKSATSLNGMPDGTYSHRVCMIKEFTLYCCQAAGWCQ